ncbi:MAG: hypothetical protein IAI50_17335 [Candidatus Eremiobacteraeota bacterium]|nr:hypothetical protein [Candidatus Eremiobacteraeota bacterium]
MIVCVEVALIIPDNEARTALATLQRLGVAAEGLERADLYRFDVAADFADALLATLRGSESIFNPNKHALRVRQADGPVPGEVWVDEIGHEARSSENRVRVAGRLLPGVRSCERFKAWRLAAANGSPASSAVLDAATETLLCNPAFQKVIRA